MCGLFNETLVVFSLANIKLVYIELLNDKVKFEMVN